MPRNKRATRDRLGTGNAADKCRVYRAKHTVKRPGSHAHKARTAKVAGFYHPKPPNLETTNTPKVGRPNSAAGDNNPPNERQAWRATHPTEGVYQTCRETSPPCSHSPTATEAEPLGQQSKPERRRRLAREPHTTGPPNVGTQLVANSGALPDRNGVHQQAHRHHGGTCDTKPQRRRRPQQKATAWVSRGGRANRAPSTTGTRATTNRPPSNIGVAAGREQRHCHVAVACTRKHTDTMTTSAISNASASCSSTTTTRTTRFSSHQALSPPHTVGGAMQSDAGTLLILKRPHR